jgi:L-glutamine-phosphate cytidylyltransferase
MDLKAVILAAGQGKRLLPITETRPKCLVRFAGRTLLEWQIRSLYGCGVTEIVVVTGFAAESVEREIARIRLPGLSIRPILNPFFTVSDNLASCFMAKHEIASAERLVLVNGDTLFEPPVLARVLRQATAPITVTIDRKERYDADDMKVEVSGDRLLHVGKTLDPETVGGESIGLLVMSREGAVRFATAVESAMREPSGLKSWFLSVIDRLATSEGIVGVVSIEGLEWGEVDFPPDLRRAEEMTVGWLNREEAERPAAARA